jgi:D-glycero-D-manno-heptose 1,7-bisphosphate phosphatase
MKKVRVVFLDRDGVINKDVSYPFKPEQIVFTEGIFDLCRAAVDKGYLVVVITNQAGVAKGYFTEDDVRSLHTWMAAQFRAHGIEIARFYYCPYHAQGVVAEYTKESPLRKPQPGMFLQAAKELDLDMRKSLVVGDKHSDRILLPALRSIIIRSAYTGDDYDVEELSDVAQFL